MAENKKAMGNDPLAWLAEENQGNTSSDAAVEEKTKPSHRANKNVKEKLLKPDIEIIEQSFASLAAHGEQLVFDFYEILLSRYPELSRFFDGVSMAGQRKKLLAALVLLVNNQRKPDVLRQYLWDLGARHQEYGIAPEDYAKVASSLMDVLKKHAAESWTSEVEQAWSNTLQTVAKEMLSAYKAVGDEKMTVNITEEKITAANAELVRMRSAVDGAMTAIMMVDRDFNITYANQATLDMLSEHEGVLKEIFPGFSVKGLVGSNIDTFHKNPKHQRQLLNDPNNLPYSTDIKVGPLQFRLNVTAMIDDEGNYIGNTLEWANVTETRAKETEVARLSGAVQGAMTSIMMIDRDFLITYVNDSTVSMLKPHQDTLRTIFPGFDVDNLVGQNIDIFHKNPQHQRQLLSNPNNLPYTTEIKVGPLQFQLNVTATYAPDGEYIGNALEWSNITEAKARSLEVSRLQSAIEGSETALMMCDQNRIITYCNPAVLDLLRNRSADLRTIWPGLDVENLVGKSIDSFHKQPSHQASILSDPSKLPYKTQIQVLDLHFGLNATAIVDDQGNMIGNMVEWTDITEQKRGETEIASLIQAAQRGELRERLKADEYDGFMKTVAGGVNNLMDVVLAPTEEIISVSRAMSEGDLTKFIEGDYQGMFEELATALNNSIQKMSTTVTDITEAAVSIASAATEISQGNIDLSQRTEEQASSLEETASSMEELTSTVRQNSDNARQANQLAVDAREKAEKGGSVIQNAIHAMAAISASSKKVADIIGVIDEIAFQTNLLALNAAVEAARAGEQGRGFAVVASEVRNLAQRSAAAAKEIKELINDSGDKVKEGSALVDESGKTLEEIVEGAKKVGDIISEIAAAGLEQTSGIEQVNKAVTQMDEMTQQNAALVEEAAAASESLDEQGKSLQQLMAFFNTGIEASSHVVETKQVARHSSTRPAQKTATPQVNKPKSRPAQSNENDDEWEEF